MALARTIGEPSNKPSSKRVADQEIEIGQRAVCGDAEVFPRIADVGP